jgi:RNA polymerase sigma-70 factor (ECF subfamily)
MPLPDSPTTSPTLLSLLAECGSEDAWRTFIATYTPLIDARCRQARLQPADADDVKARVLGGLVNALRDFRYDPARKFRGYLRTAVNNAVRTHFRVRAVKPGGFGTGGGPGPPLDDLADPADPFDDLAARLDDSLTADLRTIQRVIERVRSQVGTDVWRAYWRTAIDGLPAPAVAAEIGKSVAAVYMAKSRVGRLLREAGGRESGTDPAT